MKIESLTKSVLLFKAAATIAAEHADAIKGTDFYKHEVKGVINYASKILDKELENTYKQFPDEEQQQVYFIAVNLIDKIVNILSSINLEEIPVFENILDSYINKEFVILDNNNYDKLEK